MSKKRSVGWHLRKRFVYYICNSWGIVIIIFCAWMIFDMCQETYIYNPEKTEGICTDVNRVVYKRKSGKSRRHHGGYDYVLTVNGNEYDIKHGQIIFVLKNEDNIYNLVGKQITLEYMIRDNYNSVSSLQVSDSGEIYIDLDDAIACETFFIVCGVVFFIVVFITFTASTIYMYKTYDGESIQKLLKRRKKQKKK